MTMDGKHDDGWKTAHMRGFSIHRCSGRPATLTRSVWGRCAYLSLGAAVGAIFLAGCGGSSSAPVTGASGASGASGISGSSQLSKGEFIKQADAVCAEANTAIADLSGGTTTGDDETKRPTPDPETRSGSVKRQRSRNESATNRQRNGNETATNRQRNSPRDGSRGAKNQAGAHWTRANSRGSNRFPFRTDRSWRRDISESALAAHGLGQN